MSTGRYMAFAGSTYYPSGGASDMIGRFDSRLEAKTAIRSGEKLERVEKPMPYGWGHIYDIEKDRVIWWYWGDET